MKIWLTWFGGFSRTASHTVLLRALLVWSRTRWFLRTPAHSSMKAVGKTAKHCSSWCLLYLAFNWSPSTASTPPASRHVSLSEFCQLFAWSKDVGLSLEPFCLDPRSLDPCCSGATFLWDGNRALKTGLRSQYSLNHYRKHWEIKQRQQVTFSLQLSPSDFQAKQKSPCSCIGQLSPTLLRLVPTPASLQLPPPAPAVFPIRPHLISHHTPVQL